MGSLLQSGYTIEQALGFLQKDSDAFMIALNEGKSLESILMHDKSDEFHQHLLFFLQFLSLPKSIQCANQLLCFTKGNKEKLLKQTAYPMFLLGFSYLTLYLFCVFVIPQMQAGFSQYLKQDAIFLLVSLVRNSIFLVGLFLCLGIVLMIIMKSNVTLRYLWLCKLGKLSLIRAYFSFILAGYLIEMHACGLSTKICFQYLSSNTKSYVIQEIACVIHNHLESGMDLMDALSHPLIHERFKRFVIVGSASGKLSTALGDYMALQQALWLRLMKRFAYIISGFAYSFVGIVAICVYRMMLIPLELLNTM